MSHNIEIIKIVREYYDKKLADHGPTPEGVDWNGSESQKLRFAELTKIIRGDEHFSFNDFGCGYGALYDHLLATQKSFEYHGFDLSENMISQARNMHRDQANCRFSAAIDQVKSADYTVASGIFNVKLSTDNKIWLDYILSVLEQLNNLSNKGFAFNCLTAYSDNERMKDYLYYADPLYLFDYCKKNFSRNITLLHDYDLYEFTILIKKTPNKGVQR